MTIDQTEPRGTFSSVQTRQLLAPINPKRVVQNAHTKPHLSQQDVLAHLVRVLGFGHFDVEVLSSELLFEDKTTNSNNKPAWSVGYRALVRLYVRDEQQRLVAYYDGGSTGESEGQPSRAASHDLAYKSALSTSMKRAAIALGDQFGLSLYNKGQQSAIVKGTLVGSNFEGDDVQRDVDQQEVDGGREGETEQPAEDLPDAPAGRTKPTTGTQGTKRRTRKAAEPKTPEPQPEGPVNPPDEVAPAGTLDEPTPVVAGKPIETGPMAGIVPTEAQVAAAEQVRTLQEQGTDTSVAEAIATAPIPAEPVGPQGDDPREPEPEPDEYAAPADDDGPAVLADRGTGEISATIDATPQAEAPQAPAANSPEAWADWAWTEAQRRAGAAADEIPPGADLAAVVYESGRDRSDMMALWKMAEQHNVLTTELRMGLINAGKAAQDRHDQAASA